MSHSSFPARVEAPGDWAERGACIDHPELDWYRLDGGHADAKAKAICATCPVQTQCLQHACTAGEVFGIWGGRTPDERARLTSRMTAAAYPQIPHGTARGYQQERRRGVIPCAECRAAAVADNKAQQARRRARLAEAVGE
jgi:WhiB family redox-sensing transcriptional regulator